jgi:hypothetical protein
MARQELERLIGRAVLDPEFRQELFADPEKAVHEAGFDLSEEEMAGLKKVDPQQAQDAIEGMAALTALPWA